MRVETTYSMGNGMPTVFVKGDGYGEKNDCTVRALAEFLEVPYPEAYDALKDLGRQKDKGFVFSTVADTYGLKSVDIGIRRNVYTGCYVGSMTIGTFCKRFRKGRFVCRTTRHVFVVKNGVPVDHCTVNPNQCLTHVWSDGVPPPAVWY